MKKFPSEKRNIQIFHYLHHRLYYKYINISYIYIDIYLHEISSAYYLDNIILFYRLFYVKLLFIDPLSIYILVIVYQYIIICTEMAHFIFY